MGGSFIARHQDKYRRREQLDSSFETRLSQSLGRVDFRREYVKAINVYRRIATYDVRLAKEVFVSTLMFAYTFARPGEEWPPTQDRRRAATHATMPLRG